MYEDAAVTFADFLHAQKTANGRKLILLDRNTDKDLAIVSCMKGLTKDMQLAALKGVVFDKESKELVAAAFPPTKECSQRDFMAHEQHLDFAFKVYTAYEGVLLKVFHHNGSWRMTTHKNADAFLRANWADKKRQFGQTLAQRLMMLAGNSDEIVADPAQCKAWCARHFDADLAKDVVYYWLLRHTNEERIVCRGLALDDPNAIVSVGLRQRADGNAFEWYPQVSVAGISLYRPEQLCCNSFKALDACLERQDWQREAGVICIDTANSVGNFKVLSDEYCLRSAVRDNTADLKLAYLKVRGKVDRRQLFLSLYHEQRMEFDAMEAQIYDLGKRILNDWIKRNYPVPADGGCCQQRQRANEPVFQITPCGHFVHAGCIRDNVCHICRHGRKIDTKTRVDFPRGEMVRERRNLLAKLAQHFHSYNLTAINGDNISLFMSQAQYAAVVHACLPVGDNFDVDKLGVQTSPSPSYRRA